jgi:hypothetical protein
MLSISIPTEFSNKSDLAYALRHIADLIEEGYTSGGDWDLTGEEEESEDD